MCSSLCWARPIPETLGIIRRMRYILIILHLILFISYTSLAQVREGVFVFDKNGKITSQDSVYNKIEVSKVMNNTYVVADSRYFDKDESWIKNYYTEIRTTYNDSIFYFKKIYKASCGQPNYIDKLESKVIVIKADTMFYVRVYSQDNVLLKEGNSFCYFPFYWHGTVMEYYDNGITKNENDYFQNVLVTKKRFNLKGKVIEDILWPNKSLGEYTEPYINDTSLTLDKELLRLINKNNLLNYPDEAIKNCIMGRVYISLIVTKEGKLESIQTVISVHPLIDNTSEKAILNVSQMIDSISPGTVNGVPVNMEMVIPFNFFVD